MSASCLGARALDRCIVERPGAWHAAEEEQKCATPKSVSLNVLACLATCLQGSTLSFFCLQASHETTCSSVANNSHLRNHIMCTRFFVRHSGNFSPPQGSLVQRHPLLVLSTLCLTCCIVITCLPVKGKNRTLIAATRIAV